MNARFHFRSFHGSLVRTPSILLAVGLVVAGIGGICRADSPVADLPDGMTLWPDLPTPPPTTTPLPTRAPALPPMPEWPPFRPVAPEASRARDLAVIPTPYTVSLDEVGVGSVSGVRFLATDLQDKAGWSVSGAGDVNRDGYGDVLIAFGGKAALVYGGPNGPGYRGVYDLNDAGHDGKSALFRYSNGHSLLLEMTGVYDTNRDSHDDLLFSLWQDDYSVLPRLAYVRGDSPPVGVVDVDLCASATIIQREQTDYGHLGYSIRGAGDVNGDGWPDVLTSNPTVSEGQTYGVGEAYLLYGGERGIQPLNVKRLDGNDGVRLRGREEYYSYSGSCVSGLGDVNGDGLDDFAVSDGAGAWVVHGNVDGFGHDGFASLLDLGASHVTHITGLPPIYTADPDSYYPPRVASAGDVNGDGLNDVILSSPMAMNPDAGAWNPAVWVLFGAKGGLATNAEFDISTITPARGIRIDTLSPYAGFGVDIGGVGDVNGDGFDDILIGDSFRGDARVYLIHGGARGLGSAVDGRFDLASLDGTNGVVFLNRLSEDHTGWSVSGAGDVNGDGFSDFLIGSPEAGVYVGSAYYRAYWGEAYLIYGHADPTTSTWSTHLAMRETGILRSVGLLGDGSDNGPESRCWVSFSADGVGFTELPTGWMVGGPPANPTRTIAVTLLPGSFAAAGLAIPLPIRWQVSTEETAPTGGRLRFRYTESEAWGVDESSIQLYRSPGGNEPFQLLPTVRDPETRTLQTRERVPLSGVFAVAGYPLLSTPTPTATPPEPTPTRTLPPTPTPLPTPCPTDSEPAFDAYAFEDEIVVHAGDIFTVAFSLVCNDGNPACWCRFDCYEIDYDTDLLINTDGLCPRTAIGTYGGRMLQFQAYRAGESDVSLSPGPPHCYGWGWGRRGTTRVIVEPAATPFATITPAPYADYPYDCYPIAPIVTPEPTPSPESTPVN